MMNKLNLTLLAILFSSFLYSQESKSSFAAQNYQKLDPDESVRCIYIDKQNYKWLGTDRGLYRMISMDHEPEIISKDSITGITEDKKSNLWFGNRTQQLQTSDKLQNIIMEQTKAQISSMAYYKGDLWVGTNEGLFRVSDDQAKILNHYTVKNSKLNSNVINFVYADKNERLWIGTDDGISKVEKHNLTTPEKNHRFTGAIATVEGVWLLAEDMMWLVYPEEGHERWADAALKRGLSQGQVRSLTADSKGRIYVASEILVQFDPVKDLTTEIGELYGYTAKQSLSIACDKNDDLWVGTADKGLFRIDVKDGDEIKFNVIAYSKGEIRCPGDKNAEIIVIAKGGRTPYSYKWNIPGIKGSKKDSLGAGEYKITVTDAEGEDYESKIIIKEPEAINIELISKEPVSETGKKDGKATISISGGTPPYRILWSNGKVTLTNNGLSAGKNSVKIIDQNNCPFKKEIVIDQPKVIADLDRKKIKVGQTLQINQLFFVADSTDINPESYAVLDEIVAFLSINKDVVVEIGGHTNSLPSNDFCDKLSTARAKNVAEYVKSKGIAGAQVQYKGYGKHQPIASNDTLAGRKKNQRVELKIVSME